MAHDHEGTQKAPDMLLGILNLAILILSSLFLVRLTTLYKKGDDDNETKTTKPQLKINMSFSYQSSLDSQYNLHETKYVFYFVICGILCVCIASLCGAIFYFQAFCTPITTTSEAIFESTYELFWNLGEIACYCLFVDRLKASFRNTSYEISDVQLTLFRVLIVIYLLCVLTFCFYTFDSVCSEFYTNEIFPWIYVFGIETIDFFIAFWLMYLFCTKLLHVTMDINSSKTYFMDNLNAKNVLLLNKISKYCVLCIIAISSTQIVNIFQIIIFLVIEARKGDADVDELAIVALHRAVVTLDMLINALCLFLTISYSSGYYDKFCGVFQNGIKTCCDACSSTSMMRRREAKAYEMALLANQ